MPAAFFGGAQGIYTSLTGSNTIKVQFYLFQSGANVLVAFGPDTIQIDNTANASPHATDFVFF